MINDLPTVYEFVSDKKRDKAAMESGNKAKIAKVVLTSAHTYIYMCKSFCDNLMIYPRLRLVTIISSEN